jgi:hypothetical protein
MLFLVIKEFEPEDCDEHIVDNTVYVVFNQTHRSFDLYVNRRESHKVKFVPYKVSVSSIKKVISFLKYIFFQKSTLQIDLYHGDSISDRIAHANADTLIGYLFYYQNESYNVAGFTRSISIDNSFGIIKGALTQLKNTY